MAVENFKPTIVNPKSETYYDALGIPEERAMFLIQVVQIILEARNDISEVMIACAEVAKTPNEVCFVLFKAGEMVGVHYVTHQNIESA